MCAEWESCNSCYHAAVLGEKIKKRKKKANLLIPTIYLEIFLGLLLLFFFI